MAMLPIAELEGLIATAHLLRSPRNADRLRSALDRARSGEGEPVDITTLKKDLGLDGD